LGGAAETEPGKRANFPTQQMDEFSCRGKNFRALGDQMSAVRDIAVFVGSLRKESLNRKLAKALAELAPSSLKLEIVEIGQLPLYNQDFDEDPSSVYVEFRARVRAADGVLFVTPEYNRSVPGALKNALDVASRPYGQSAWNGKPEVCSWRCFPLVESAPRAYRLEASNAASSISTMIGTSPRRSKPGDCKMRRRYLGNRFASKERQCRSRE
jgi:hypothetical protein